MKHARNSVVAGESRSTKARLQEAWQSTLGRFATAEDGSRNLVQRLVEWGKITGDEGKTLLADWRKAIENNRKLLERRVDEAVHKSIARFKLPSRIELDAIAAQVGRLEQRMRALKQRLADGAR
jgi:polyhydroxyalkanoate synthesis regulator phasin